MNDSANVLVVDDNQKNLDAMEALLTKSSRRILRAQSGDQALELLLRHEVALALLDVNMPEMDGFELAEFMRANPQTRTIPIMFITAAISEPARTFQGYQHGAVDFLNKPFDSAILDSKVDVFVQLYLQRKQLAQQLAELKKALEINETFTAVLSHDLRTPLGAVLNGAQLISMVADQPKVLAASKVIHSSGQRMEKMIRQLLDVAKTRSRDVGLDLVHANYRDVAMQIIEELSDPDRPVDIRIKSYGNTEAVFDVDRISQVLSNLVGNALHHGQNGAPISVSIDGSGKEQVVVSVHNIGHIPAEWLSRIFEPYQSANMQRPASGMCQ